jgi:superfamily II DNA or RNA helicase
MPVAEKKAVMALFSAGLMGVLVSTTVIEVGVDVPNASLMVIEHAERFGLSQLHQLRGRVGRGAAASACVLLYSPPDGGRLSETARERLKAMAETNDGFEIARRDLEIRGPGNFWARASRARPCCASPTWPPTATCWNGPKKAATRVPEQSGVSYSLVVRLKLMVVGVSLRNTRPLTCDLPSG